MWFVQQRRGILNAWQCGGDDTRTKRLRSPCIDRCHALLEFAAWSTKELGANWSKSQWLPLRPNGDLQIVLDTGHTRLVATTGGNALKRRRSLQCGVRHIRYHTTCGRSGGQFFPWPRCHRLEAVKNHKWDPSRRTRCKAVCSSQYRDFRTYWPRIEYHKNRKWLGNGEWGGGKEIAQNGHGSRLFGDVAGQPKPTCYPEGISRSKEADNCHRIHFGHATDRRSNPGHLFHMMVRLHLNCQKDHICHQLCLQRTSMEDELKSQMSARSGESTVIQSKVTRTAHLNSFRTPMIG